MKNEKATLREQFFSGINITIDPSLDNVSRKGTEKKIAEAKRILAKVKLHETALAEKNATETIL